MIYVTKEEAYPIKILAVGSIATLKTKKAGPIILEKARTLTVTTRVEYESGADVSLVTRLYYVTEDGKHDTVPYTSISLTVTADAVVQRTLLVDPPEDGAMMVEVYNPDNQAVGKVTVTYSLQRWPD